jgi:Transglycosylase
MSTAAALEYSIRSLRTGGRTVSALREIRARAARRHPLLANFAIMPFIMGGAGVAAAVQVVPLLVQPFGDNVRYEIEESDARKLGTALSDSKGRWIGAFPSRLDSDRRFNEGETVKFDDIDLSGKSFPIYPDHKVLFVERPPQHYLTCLKRLEDSNMGNWLINPHGVDAIGLLRIPASGMKSGGSSLSSQLVQQLIRPKGQSEGRMDAIRRKGEEIFWTAPLMFGYAPNDRRFDQLVARHLPHVQYTQQDRSVLWGIEASSRVLFNAPADDSLPKAAQYILAGSIRRPLVFPVARDHATGQLLDRTQVASDHWQLAIKRARVCADDPQINPDVIEREQINRDLDARSKVLPAPKADPVIEELGRERYGERWPERARDPFRRANIFAYNAMQALVSEFRDALTPSWSRQVSSVTMSIDLVDERRFSPQFRATTRQWLAGRPALNPVYRPWVTYAVGEAEPVDAIPDILAVVVDDRSKIVRYYSSREGAPFYGLQRDENGRYQPQKEDQPLASLGKIGNALVLIRSGELSSPAISAFAHSDSDAVTAATMRADSTGIVSRQVMQSLMWTSNAAKDDAGHDLDARWAMSHGLAAASGRTVLWNGLSITNALANDYRPVAAPSLIESLTLVDLKAGKLFPTVTSLRSAYEFAGLSARISPAVLVRPQDRRKALQLLSSPICAGGTLRSLASWCSGKRTRFIWAKTGTTDSTDTWNRENNVKARGVVDRLAITGGVEFPDGRRFALYLSVGGQSSARPLMIGKPGQRDAEAAQIAPLFGMMLTDLAQQTPTGAGRDR